MAICTGHQVALDQNKVNKQRTPELYNSLKCAKKNKNKNNRIKIAPMSFVVNLNIRDTLWVMSQHHIVQCTLLYTTFPCIKSSFFVFNKICQWWVDMVAS